MCYWNKKIWPILTLTLGLMVLCLQTPWANNACAEALANQLFFELLDVLASDLGLLIGLAISAAGFVQILYGGLNTMNVALLALGVVFTALPGLFLQVLGGAYSAFAPLGGNLVSISPNDPNFVEAACRPTFAEYSPVQSELRPCQENLNSPECTQAQNACTANQESPECKAQKLTPGELGENVVKTEHGGYLCAGRVGFVSPNGHSIISGGMFRGNTPGVGDSRTRPGRTYNHGGLDVYCPANYAPKAGGCNVHAPCSGTVQAVRRGSGLSGGNRVQIRCDDGGAWNLMHLEFNSLNNLSVDSPITEGGVVGVVGATGGYATGVNTADAHVHAQYHPNAANMGSGSWGNPFLNGAARCPASTAATP